MTSEMAPAEPASDSREAIGEDPLEWFAAGAVHPPAIPPAVTAPEFGMNAAMNRSALGQRARGLELVTDALDAGALILNVEEMGLCAFGAFAESPECQRLLGRYKERLDRLRSVYQS
jgi:hypothetical protein